MDTPAKNMDNSAVPSQPIRRPTPHRPVKFLVGDEFHSDASYDNWRPDGTDDWLLIYTVSGTGIAASREGRTRSLHAGQALLYVPGAYQSYATAPSASAWRILWFHFHPMAHWLELLRWPEIWEGCRWAECKSERARSSVRAALAGAVRAMGRWKVQRAANGLELALIELAECAGGGRRETDARIESAARWIAENLAERWTVGELARRFGFSSSRFAHRFREEVGESPAAFATRLRMESAARMLRFTSEPVARIAEAHGFDDPFHFSRSFRRHFGHPPSKKTHSFPK